MTAMHDQELKTKLQAGNKEECASKLQDLATAAAAAQQAAEEERRRRTALEGELAAAEQTKAQAIGALAAERAELAEERVHMEEALLLTEQSTEVLAQLNAELAAAEQTKAQTIGELAEERAALAQTRAQLEDQRRVTEEETAMRTTLQGELAEERVKTTAALAAMEQTKAQAIEDLSQRVPTNHEQTSVRLQKAGEDMSKLQASTPSIA